MKQRYFSFLSVTMLIALLAMMTACKKDHKVVEDVFDDGSPRIVKYYSKEGPDAELKKETIYFKSGKKHMEGNYKNNKREGKWTSWYDNGVIWSEGYYKDGLGHGERKAYYPNGKLRFQGMMENDKEVGVWQYYDENGSMVKEVDYDKTDATDASQEIQ
ncbi:MAG: toxin-antitoxin system YwqK family antitoxin [Bacteroidales bacterium]|nr:toxin-antitoxin system YwqK family antitoxin [Bacteroidales bacterium]